MCLLLVIALVVFVIFRARKRKHSSSIAARTMSDFHQYQRADLGAARATYASQAPHHSEMATLSVRASDYATFQFHQASPKSVPEYVQGRMEDAESDRA